MCNVLTVWLDVSYITYIINNRNIIYNLLSFFYYDNLLNCITAKCDQAESQLNLALAWDRCDVARDTIFLHAEDNRQGVRH